MEIATTPLFRKEYNQYTRDFDYVKLWAEQCTTYAKIEDPQLDEEQYKAFLLANIGKKGLFPLKNPRMSVILKDENNDRYHGQTTMMDYLKDIVQQDLKFAPTFTTYYPEKRMKSVEAAFLDIGMANRSKEKKLKFKAKEAGNDLMADYHDKMQQKLKVLNNSSSGAKATEGVILYNQTGHSTLTSICRSTTSFSNAINEKLLGGLRHFYDEEVVINNIIATLTYVDENKVKAVIDKYNLHYVTQEELLWAIKRSTDIYWRCDRVFKKIENFVAKLTPLQCSTYLYNSDFFMLRQFNDSFMRNWLVDLINTKDILPLSLEEAKEYVALMDDDLAALVAVYVSHLCNGKSVRTAMNENPDIIPTVGAVIKNTIMVFERYRDLIEVFLVSEMVPHDTALVPGMMRGVVLGSDTDSSLFSLDCNWVYWYYGEILHHNEARALVATNVYITSQHIAHVLGMMTGILNVIDEKKALIAMKNEFLFSSFTTTSRGKHYYAKKDAQEGIMIPSSKMETEVKGVALKHTKVPIHIKENFHGELNNVMNTIERDEKYSILDFNRRLAKLEHEVYQSIKAGQPLYLQRGQVKVKEAYKDAEKSIYKRGHEVWEAVFATKYGSTTPPPYDCIKIATKVDTRAKMMTWLATVEDKAFVERYINWVDSCNNGKPIKTFYIPQAVAESVGLPTELFSIMEPRKLVYTIVAPYYLLMESFNIYMANKHITRLVSDDFDDLRVPDTLFNFGGDDDNDESDD